nr:reverse transcriptase domain-containing protein [Leptospira noguchii]
MDTLQDKYLSYTMGRSHAIIFEEYFSDLDIIKSLINYRLKLAERRHESSFFDRIIQSEKLEPKAIEKQLSKIFPPRNYWKRPSFEKRKTSKNRNVDFISLLFTVNYFRSQSINRQPKWVFELNKLIKEIRYQALYSQKIELSTPKLSPILKNKKEGEIDLYRPISIIGDLSSRIVMNLTARYLMDQLDVVFKNSSFAFRRGKIYQNRVPTHHDCFKEIKRFKKGKENLYISECDIKAFFDIISHDEIRKSYAMIKDELFKLNGTRIFGRADDFVEAFLNSYSIDYAISESEMYFKTNNIKGKLSFPKDELLNTFYSGNAEALKSIGVPQGTSFSILFANLILHDNDRLMEEKFNNTDGFLYMRYCDDMIILSAKENEANKAYEEYIKLLKEKKLLHHNEKPLFPYLDSSTKRDFWDRKSRKGYQWSKNSYPWITFVGYQIRYDDFVRIRSSSIKKETKKQKEFVEYIDRRIRKQIKKEKKDQILKSYKSILNRVKNRMISSGIGRVSLFRNKTDSSYSWINGFRGILDDDKVFRTSLKELDRNRDEQLKWLDDQLFKVLKKHQIAGKKPKRIAGFYYTGRPYSYFYRSLRNDDIEEKK